MIGLALSGGGYRAAAFHLGMLSYFEHRKLLPAVQMISTVSGGTFIGAAFALSLSREQDFKDFFRDFYGNMKGVDLVGLGLERLGGTPPDVPSARHDLIVSMAEVYGKTFFRNPDAPGEPYLFGRLLDSPTQLSDIIFNATEFRNGIAFRFQTTGRIGNNELRIPEHDARDIRIVDIVAASSCFPGGFEPMAFPDDFSWPANGEALKNLDALVRKSPYDGPVALMDGGIYDNQGTESLWYAVKRKPEGWKLDMFLISDVDQESDDYYVFPKDGPTGGLTLGTVNLLARALTLACVLTVILVGIDAWSTVASGEFTFWGLFRYVVPLFLAVVTAGTLRWGRKTIRRRFGEIPNVGRAAWSDLRRLRLGQVSEMLQLRMTSLMALASEIFMYRVRRLGNQAFYANEALRGSGGYKSGPRVSNLIYHLRKGRGFFFKGRSDVPAPSQALWDVVEVAATMSSTLWWDDHDDAEEPKIGEQPSIVITGQATLCYNLMKYVTRNCGEDPQKYPYDVKELWDGLLADWTRFTENPRWLLDELLPAENI